MRKMLNTLYIISDDAYASLKGETVEVLFPNKKSTRIPLHTLENIVTFSYKGASPQLMGKCEEYGKPVVFFTPSGRYLATVGAAIKGNVLLRRQQYRVADQQDQAIEYSRNMIVAKVCNSKNFLLRFSREHQMQVDCEKLNSACQKMSKYMFEAKNVTSMDSLRGIEGIAATEYFGVFNELILQRKEVFRFYERVRRPPTDRVNAMLSFAYSLLANECTSALISVGLDPYVGFLHVDRPGRKSFALDLMEELRCVMADRFVLKMINNRVFNDSDFETQDSGAVLFKDESRKEFISRWQEKKKEEIKHPYLKEKMPWGLVPYTQAVLLARCLRDDLDQYPPFFWR